jgi:hypothetical protein
LKDEEISKMIGHLLSLRDKPEVDAGADPVNPAADLLDSMGELYKTRGVNPDGSDTATITGEPRESSLLESSCRWESRTGVHPSIIDPATGLPALICQQGTVDPACPGEFATPPTGREDIPFWTESHVDLITNTAFPDPFLNDSDGHAGTTHDIDILTDHHKVKRFEGGQPAGANDDVRPAVALSTVLESDDFYTPHDGTNHVVVAPTVRAFCRVYEESDRNAPVHSDPQIPWGADAETIATCELEHKTKCLAARFKPSYLFPPFIRKRIESGELLYEGVLQLENGTIEYDNWLVETDPAQPLTQMTPEDFHNAYRRA